MQVLKKEIRDRIIRSARTEFRKNGFKKASMREISNHAEMTVGNLYRYYKNKEELYGAIIGPLDSELKLLEKTENNKVKELKVITNGIKELQGKYPKEWIILFNGSSGTRFEHTVKKLEKVLNESLRETLKSNPKLANLAEPLTIALINGMNAILKANGRKSAQLAEDYINYLFKGI